MNKTLIILFGAPGSGKGFLGDCIKQEIISQNIVSDSQIGYISTGDLLRAEVASNSPLGQQISQIITSGKLVSDDIVDTLVEKALNGEEQILFVDGYPRTPSQLDNIISIASKKGIELVSIKRDTPTELILKRVQKRRVCESCKATHSVDDGKCPKCGGNSIIRKDDAVIEKRLDEYEKNTAPIWEDVKEASQKNITVDGSIEATNASKYIVATLFAC
jgi:adenylate kinase